ncbi:MAG: sulfatase, partial [Bacteroidales bacterium]
NTPLPTVRPDLLTLPGLLRKNGYTTISLGKVFHHGKADAPDAWSVDPWMPPAGQWVNPSNMRGTNDLTEEAAGSRPRAFERYDAEDGAYRDGQVASKALSYLSSLSKSGQPFFLAAGFIKPHLPFVCPEKYWRLYDNETINLPAYQAKPEGGPDIAMTNWGELRRYKGIPAVGPLPADTSRLLIQGYMACVSFTDAQVGKLLDEVERLGLKDNTVIVLFGDHGWHLGDHGLWCKHTNFEQATRAPLIIYVPGIKGGKSESAMVEFVDVYPSIAEVCGLSPEKQTEGRSLVQLMKNPGMNWNEVAFSQYPRGRIMGYSARTQRFRYTAWIDKQGRITQSEFYDYLTDPLETKNNVRNPEYQPEVENLKSLVTSYASGRYIKDKGATGPQ